MGGVELFYTEESVELPLINRPDKKAICKCYSRPTYKRVILSDYVYSVLGMVLLDLKKRY